MSVDLLDACYAVLLNAKGPVHWHALHEGCVLLGASPDSSRSSVNKVWTSIDKDIKAQGDASRFRYLGRNVFVAAEFFNPTDVKEKKAYTSRKPVDPFNPRPTEIPVEERRCGNCKYLGFYGPHFLYQRGGHCDNDAKSGRPYVRVEMEPCAHWRQRSREQKAADRREQENDRITAIYGPRDKKKKNGK